MRPGFLSLFVLAAAGVTCALHAQQSLTSSVRPSPVLLILSKQNQTLSLVDPATLKVVGSAPVGEDPHEVVASPDGRTAYVSNYGFGRFHTLAVVDLPFRKRLPSIDLGALHGPHGLAFADGKVWFTAEAAKVIGRYDPETGQVDWVMGTGQNRTHMLSVLTGAQRIVTTNVNSGTVTVLEKVSAPGGPPPAGAPAVPGFPQGAILPPGGDWLETVIPVGRRDEGFDVAPNGQEAWVANAGDGTVSVVDLNAKKTTATLSVDVPGANRLKFTPDGRLALVSSMNRGELTVIDVAARKVLKRIAVGHGGAGILVQPDGLRAYAACPPDGWVAVIDLKTLAVVGHIDAGPNPDGMAWVGQ